MRQKVWDWIWRALLIIYTAGVLIPVWPVDAAAKVFYENCFETAGELKGLETFGSAVSYVNSGMLKLRVPNPGSEPVSSGFRYSFAQPFLSSEEAETVLEVRMLFGTTANVKEMFVINRKTPLVFLDNGNDQSDPEQMGILANTANGKIVLKQSPGVGKTAYAPNIWHHICVVLGSGGFDVYLNGEKLNDERLALPDTVKEISSVGCGLRSWSAETALVDDFRIYTRESPNMTELRRISPVRAELRFSNPLSAGSLSAICVTSDQGRAETNAKLAADLHTVELTFTQLPETGTVYTVSFSGIQDLFGSMVEGSAALYQEAEPLPVNPVTDELDDVQIGKNHLFSYTTNQQGKPAFGFDRMTPELYCGDKSRIFLGENPGPSELVYYLPEGVTSCRITTFEAERRAPARYEIEAAVSADGENFISVQMERRQMEERPKDTSFRMYQYTCRDVGGGNVYFKLTLKREPGDDSVNLAWTPKVASVELNCMPLPKGRLLTSIPKAGAERVAPHSVIQLSFDRILNPDTLAEGFSVNGNTPQAELLPDGRTVRLSGVYPGFGAEVCVSVRDSLQTLDGQSCETAEVRFRTAERCAVSFLDENGTPIDRLKTERVVPVAETKEETLVTACVQSPKGLTEVQSVFGKGEIEFQSLTIPEGGKVGVYFWDGTQRQCPVADPVCLTEAGIIMPEYGAGVLEDTFDDLRQIVRMEGELRCETEYAVAYNGDAGRLAGTGKSWVMYHFPEDLKGLRLLCYGMRDSDRKVCVQMSEDGVSFRTMACEEQEIGRLITHPMTAYEQYQEIPERIRYVRILFDEMVQLGDLKLFYGDYDLSEVTELRQELDYDYGDSVVRLPDAQTIQRLVQEKTSGTHPRLMASKEDFDRIRDNQNQEPYAGWLAKMKSYADSLGASGSYTPVPFIQTQIESEKKDFLSNIREIKKRVETLAVLWQVTGNEKYGAWCWRELENVCGFPTLYPEHFLNVGEGALSMAVGYDWLYAYLTPEQRQTLENGIIRLGISPALPYMRGGYGFVNNTNNWNSVCNGGVGAAALCFAERREDCAEAAAWAVQYSVKGFRALAPEGAYPEGPGYWDFGTEYAVCFISSLQTAAGDSFGLEQLTGMSETGLFPLYATSPIGKVFNFADGGDGKLWAPQLFWLAKQYSQPACGYLEYDSPSPQAYDLLWYDPDYVRSPAEQGLPLNKKLGGSENLAVFRQNWTNPNALYAALKGGDNQSSHGDLDIGSFVIDALGVRWAEELGASYYHSPGYWESDADAGRWTYYRKRAEGHNTLVLNPGMKPDQDVYAVAEVDPVLENGDGASAVLDMTAAYAEDARSVKRRMSTFHNSTEVLLQDVVMCDEPSDLFWFMQTPADVEISVDGREAVLTQQGKRMKVKLAEPAEAVFSVERAAPLPESPHPENDQLGHRRLVIHLPETTEAKIAVIFTPIWDSSYENTKNPLIYWGF